MAVNEGVMRVPLGEGAEPRSWQMHRAVLVEHVRPNKPGAADVLAQFNEHEVVAIERAFNNIDGGVGGLKVSSIGDDSLVLLLQSLVGCCEPESPREVVQRRIDRFRDAVKGAIADVA